MSNNPLAKYYRQPKIFVKLPSNGKFYPEGSIDLSESGEYPVYGMTAKDELLLKTPDALLNGEATVRVIKSCFPAIINPWLMPSIDVDNVLSAIRIASYGENLDIDSSCPKCTEENSHSFNLVQFLSQNNDINIEHAVQIDELTVKIRPYTYKELATVRFKTREQQNVLGIVNDDRLSEEQKLQMFSESFLNLTDLTIETIVGCIEEISTPEGTVNDQALIREFVENSTNDVFENIHNLVKKMKNDVELKPQTVKCSNSECNHEYEVSIALDQSNFFKVRSQD
jgi:hypothetical protein